MMETYIINIEQSIDEVTDADFEYLMSLNKLFVRKFSLKSVLIVDRIYAMLK